MIQLASLSKAFGDRVLLDEVSWQIRRPRARRPERTERRRQDDAAQDARRARRARRRRRHQTVGPHDRLPAAGRAQPQRPHAADEAGLAFKPLLDMRKEIATLEDRLADDTGPESEHAAMLTPLQRAAGQLPAPRGLQHRSEDHDGAARPGILAEDLDRPTETFSGGWQMRIALAKLLLGRPGLLLLDEPTNHLDLDARNWLEEYLSDYPHAVILVSHDRFFLDAVVTRITEIGLRRLTDYTGNYSDYLREREARMERLRQQKSDQDDEVARMKAFINRFRYQATKAAQVQSRIKMLDKIVPIEIPPERKRVRFSFPACAKSGRTVLDLRGVSKAYGDRACLRWRQPAHRARRSHRAHRPERRRQVHA